MAVKTLKNKKGRDVICQNPCKDYIFGGCGICPSNCHQHIWYYDKSYSGERSENAAYEHRFDLFDPREKQLP